MKFLKKFFGGFGITKPKKNALTCLDCNSEKFYTGPTGGMSENVMCMDCGSAFNYCPGLMMDRISNRHWTDSENPKNRAPLVNGEPAPRKNDKGKITEFGHGKYEEKENSYL